MNTCKKKKKKCKKSFKKGYNKIYDFTKFKTIQSFGVIKNDIITMDMSSDEQDQFAKSVIELISNTRLINRNMRKEKESINNNDTSQKKEDCL